MKRDSIIRLVTGCWGSENCSCPHSQAASPRSACGLLFGCRQPGWLRRGPNAQPFLSLSLRAGTRTGRHDIPPRTPAIPWCRESSISALPWSTRPSLVWPWPDFQPHRLPGSPSQPVPTDHLSVPTRLLFFCLSLLGFMLVPPLVMSLSLLCLSSSPGFSKVRANGISLQTPCPGP